MTFSKFFERPVNRLSKTPDSDKDFLHNYLAHLHYLNAEYGKKEELMTFSGATKSGASGDSLASNVIDRLKILGKECLNQVNCLEQLRDVYDLVDDGLGATVLPVVSFGYSLYCLFKAAWYGILLLGQETGLLDVQGKKENSMAAIDNAMIALAAFALSIESLIKSIISLIVRPIITAIKGYNNQNSEIRFHYEDQLLIDFGNNNVKPTLNDPILNGLDGLDFNVQHPPANPQVEPVVLNTHSF